MRPRSNRAADRIRRGALAALVAAVQLGGAAPFALAQEDESGCVYDRRVYPEGYEMCQGDDRVRCEDGAWSDVGDCDEPEPGPPPATESGDVEQD